MTAIENCQFQNLLPHRPPMLMLATILEQDSDSVHCTSVIAATNPLLSDGLFPVIGGVELLAQAAGTLLGARTPGTATRPGAIVQVKSFQVEPLDIPVGAELHIHARCQAGTAEAALFEGEVMFGEQRFFTGTLMIALLPEDAG
jgi:predicted hotdog family 3-hydroxylacyl-ACP dehydratase